MISKIPYLLNRIKVKSEIILKSSIPPNATEHGLYEDILELEKALSKPSVVSVEITPEQLHQWYLEAVTHLDGRDFNLEADVPYKDLTEGQKSISKYIANKINEINHPKAR